MELGIGEIGKFGVGSLELGVGDWVWVDGLMG